MLIACLRLYTEGLTSGDDDLEHDLDRPNLVHSNDFGDNEEVPFADVAEECAFLFHEDELEDDCDELTNDWILDDFHNEKVDMNDDLASDEGDMLDAKDHDVYTIDAGEGL